LGFFGLWAALLLSALDRASTGAADGADPADDLVPPEPESQSDSEPESDLRLRI
jgi:hypothetical protein